MARTAITPQTPAGNVPGPYPAFPISGGTFDLTWTGTSDTTARYVAITNSKSVVLARNTDTTAHTITFTSQPDSFKRTGDISGYSIGPGTTSWFGPFLASGWSDPNAGGSGVAGLDIDVSDPKVVIAVVNLP